MKVRKVYPPILRAGTPLNVRGIPSLEVLDPQLARQRQGQWKPRSYSLADAMLRRVA